MSEAPCKARDFEGKMPSIGNRRTVRLTRPKERTTDRYGELLHGLESFPQFVFKRTALHGSGGEQFVVGLLKGKNLPVAVR